MELLLMRHAKSDWHQGVSDFDRPLNQRGVEAAGLMGKLLQTESLMPEHIICSGAQRAQETTQHLVEESEYVGKITVSNQLYLCDISDFIRVIRKYGDIYTRLMVIAHNPGTEGFITHLTGQQKHVTTANIAHITLPIHQWSDFDLATQGELTGYWRPREPQS